ncbi:MAG: hypothetical protein FJX75_03210 [Armatimonadetes bacterium]|nr:hypothetical protein [Armatimonadota bacterium]
MPEAAEAVIVETPRQCYRCKALLHAATPDVCPECGRAQSRVCFCGVTISRGAATCPACETDWSRIRRSRGRSKVERRERTWRAALIGGAGALLVVGIAYGIRVFVVTGRAQYGVDAAGSAFGALGNLLLQALRMVWIPAVIFVVGAVGGVAVRHIRRQRRRRRRRRVSGRSASSEV